MLNKLEKLKYSLLSRFRVFRKKRWPFLHNHRGIAILQALFMVMLITFIVNQVSFETAVEYTTNAQALHRVKAYQAAKAGVQISLLRLALYQKARAQFGQDLGPNAQMLDFIYSFPLTWPLMAPGDLSSVDKDGFEAVNKTALMDATYSTQIQSEDLLNINDLGSTVEAQRNRVRNHLIEILKGKVENDREWTDKHGNIPYEEIVNNLQDWVDRDNQRVSGGSESEIYGRLREMDPDNKDTFPPNRHFRTLEEIRMVPGVTDAIFDLLKGGFSTFGPMGINPNYADEDALKSLHPQMTDEMVSKIMARRSNPDLGGRFDGVESFIDYLSRDLRLPISEEEGKQMPLRFTDPCNFRIESSGASGKSVVTITAITFDLNCDQHALFLKWCQEQKDKGADEKKLPTGCRGDLTKSKPEASKGPPRIVFWHER
jgi:general secretion pathway protein K